jgi:nucleoside permease NupC
VTQILWGLGGSLVILAAAWLLSINRRAINWRTVGVAMVTLVAFSFAVLRWSFGRAVLETLTDASTPSSTRATPGSSSCSGRCSPTPRRAWSSPSRCCR